MTDDQWRDLRIDLPNGYDANNRRAIALLAERDALAERADALREALTELVEAHDLGAALDAEYRRDEDEKEMTDAEFITLEHEYSARMPVAWDDARAVLAAPSAPKEADADSR